MQQEQSFLSSCVVALKNKNIISSIKLSWNTLYRGDSFYYITKIYKNLSNLTSIKKTRR